jgi:hypothetical protein
MPQGRPDLNAENCYWGTNDELIIQQEIFDGKDNDSYGIVDYQPYLSAPNTTAPISPPTQFKAVLQTNNIMLTWSNNKESDLAGYKVYWGDKAGYPYDNVVDVGNVTSYLIEGPVTNTCFVTVTAYDSDYNSGSDNPATLVNENQVNGNESWYAPEQEVNHNHSISTISSMLYILLLGE